MSYGVHLCSFTTVANVKRGKYRWDFSEMFGPLFLGKDGEPLKKQPMPPHPAWTEFEAWHKEYRASKGKPDAPQPEK